MPFISSDKCSLSALGFRQRGHLTGVCTITYPWCFVLPLPGSRGPWETLARKIPLTLMTQFGDLQDSGFQMSGFTLTSGQSIFSY